MIEIRNNEDGKLYEVVHKYGCANVHLKNLGDGDWMLIVECHGDQEHRAHISITPKGAFVYEAINCEIRTVDNGSI